MRLLTGILLVATGVAASLSAAPADSQTMNPWKTEVRRLLPVRPSEMTADQVGNRINPTGRVLSMSVPLVDNGRARGEVLIRIAPDDSITLSRIQLVAALKGDAASDVLAQLETLPEIVGLADVAAKGLPVALDRSRMQLTTGMTAAQRQGGDISLGAPPPIASSKLASPATVSGFINVFADAGYRWNREETALRFDIEPVLRLYGLVVESELAWQNRVDPFNCPIVSLCLFDHTGGFKRRGTRAIYDWPDSMSRLTVGDLSTQAAAFQRAPSLLGVSLEHSPTKLAPDRPIRATGSQSFTIERPSTVQVLINGAIVQHLSLPPGAYNLRDLPLRAGSNDITLLVTDASGQSQTLTFSTHSAYSLLGVGKWEGAISAGVPSYIRDNAVSYVNDRYFVTSFIRYGLTSSFTGEASFQADDFVRMGAVGFISATPFGTFGINGAVSESSPWRSGINVASASDWSAALRGTWDIIGSQNVGALRLSAEHRFGDFRAPGQLQLFRDGILTPVFEYRSSFAATYTREIAPRWQGTITGRYDVADPKAVSRRQLAVHGDRYHIDVGVSHQLTDSISVSAIVGWSNEVYNRSLVSLADPNLHDTNGQIWAGLRLYWRPAPRTTVSASTDTLNQRSLVSGTTSTGNGIGSWTATATLADDRVRDRSTTSAAATYRGERAEATVGHDSGLRTAISGRAVNVDAGDQRTRVRVGTAIVFADGHAGVSAPIRGDSAFAILSPHPSIGNREVTAGSQDYPRARSGVLGPAVAGNLPAHVPQVLPIDVENLPPGYSLGQSGFDLKPPYRAGYVLPVGSDAAVSAYGVLLDPRGNPVSLAAGTASKGERHLTVFSSEAGRFALNGVAPGRWRVVLETDGGQLIYVIDVPQGTTLLDLGQVRPARGKLS